MRYAAADMMPATIFHCHFAAAAGFITFTMPMPMPPSDYFAAAMRCCFRRLMPLMFSRIDAAALGRVAQPHFHAAILR